MATSATEETRIARLFSVIEEFRRINPKMPIQMAAVYLAVASKSGITPSDIAKEIGESSTSAASRLALDLSTEMIKGTPGHGLIEQREDPMDKRIKHYHLTPKGARMLHALLENVK